MTTVVTATIDLDDPPVRPPAECVDPLMWRLARERFEQHRRGATGNCATCPPWRPCADLRLARDGLATALGVNTSQSPFWVAFTKITSNPRRSIGPGI